MHISVSVFVLFANGGGGGGGRDKSLRSQYGKLFKLKVSSSPFHARVCVCICVSRENVSGDDDQIRKVAYLRARQRTLPH